MRIREIKKGPPAIPSVPVGPGVLNFSPVVENIKTLDHALTKCKRPDDLGM
jgi:hypothetical protein